VEDAVTAGHCGGEAVGFEVCVEEGQVLAVRQEFKVLAPVAGFVADSGVDGLVALKQEFDDL